MSCAATAMKMKQLMRSMLLTFTLLTCLHLSVGQQINFTAGGISQGESCGTGNSQDTNGSLFQHQLNQVLDSLVVNVSGTGFDTSSVEGQNNNDFVYGLLQCRGDLNSSLCKQCASTIKTQLVQNCKNSTSGYLQLEGCFLRYDNHYFYDYSPEDIQSYGVQCNVQSIYPLYTFPFDVSEVLSNITERAVGSPKLYAADVFEEKYSASIYSLAQCWGDLSQASCNSCLSVALRKISPTSATSACSPGSNGARFYAMGCHLRYEIYPFFYAPTSSPPPTLPDGPHTPIPSPPAASSEGKKRNVFAITVGVVAATVGLIAAIGISRFRRKRWERISRTTGEINLSPSMTNLELIFKYDTLRRATSDFKAENKLGEGGFGSVFKGVLPDGREVAIKRLNIDSRQGDNEFLNEANLITRVQHRNLVRLLGCSVQRSERLLVYEYLHNSSLDKIIFDTAKSRLLNWRERYDIIVGTARGLAYLHEESEIRIIHRDIKASNILLDDKYRPKIADFGLAKLFGEDESHVSTRVAGTRGYIAPESLRGQLTEKVDVFSFGVLLLEIISGRKNHSLLQHMEFLIETTWRLYNAERALEVMDPTLEGSYSGEEGLRVIKIGLLCTQAAATLRPSMSQVVSMLTGEQQHIPLPTRPAFVDEESVLAERGIVTPRRGPNNTSSNSQSLEVATYCSTPSLTTMEPR